MLNVCRKPDISLIPLVELEEQKIKKIIYDFSRGTFSLPDFVAPHDSADTNKRRTKPHIHSRHGYLSSTSVNAIAESDYGTPTDFRARLDRSWLNCARARDIFNVNESSACAHGN